MTRAVDLANSVANGVSLGFKNRIINGAMGIWQRGTSFPAVTFNTYLADRFFWNNGGGTTGVATVSRSTDVPSGQGFPYSLLATVTTAQTSVGAGNYTNFCQRIEGFNCYDLGYGTANAQAFTASFWVKSNLTGTFTGSFSQNGTSPVRTYPYSFTINSANTWQQITITVPGDTGGTIPYSSATGITWDIAYMPIGSTYQTGTANTWNANVSGTQFSPSGVTPVNLFATVGNTFQITGVQLEVGSTATNFEYRDYGRELMMCQRYYWVIASGNQEMIGFGTLYTTGGLSSYVQAPVTMRASPTLRQVSGTSYFTFERTGAQDDFNSFTGTFRWSDNGLQLYTDQNITGTAGQSGIIYTINALASLALEAEL